MRQRVRIQPYISPDLHRRLRAYSSARRLTDSAIAEAAFAEYLDRETPDEGALLTRLQTLSEGLTRLQYDVDVIGQAFGAYVRYAFRAPANDNSTEAGRRSQQLFAQFIAVVSRELDAGLRLTGQVDRARGAEIRPQRPAGTGGEPGEDR
jgi:predicted transcriptional regulator